MGERQNTWIIGGIVGILVILMICTCCACAGGMLFLINRESAPLPPPYVPAPNYDEDTPATPLPMVPPKEPDEGGPATPLPPTSAPLPDEAEETLDALESAEIPDADLHELGIRFLGVPPDTPRVSNAESPDYEVGTRRLFHASDVDTDQQFEIYATLAYKTEHLYMWVEEGANINERRLQEAADLFEAHTYPTNREFFGSEWTPGVDNDPHLSVLHARNLGNTVAGYFSSADSYVQTVREDSNEMEMFYINIDNITIGDDFYNGVLAHEFQHMIHWNNDSNEDTWLNEGCSELAMELNNRAYPGGHYDVGGSEYSYLRRPDTQLNSWPEGTAGSASANYGGAYLFVSYFLDRFGESATQSLVAHAENGMDSVDAVLSDTLSLSFDHKVFFADWTVANLLDDSEVEDGQYYYVQIDPAEPRIDTTYRRASDYPVDEQTTVYQYGVDYIEVNSKNPLRFGFTGTTEVGLMDTDAHSGKYLWWSNRSDESDARLTYILDLNNATEAEMRFQTWYHIEEDWDYAYVVVGTSDSGTLDEEDVTDPDRAKYIHWTILDDASLGCTSTNPNGNNFGCGMTGKSDDWEQLSADLSDYVGQDVALRFEYITDAAVNQAGFAIDDVEILQDGERTLFDDMESEDHPWIAEGFVRHANILPQEWLVQLVTFNGQTQVQRLLLADGTYGEWVIPFTSRMDKAVLIVSAMAPVTTESASYRYTLTPED